MFFLAAALVLGCGAQHPDDPGYNPTGGGEPPPMGSNGQCHDLTPGGGFIMDQQGSAPPALGGGVMVDGRYVLTRYEWYQPNQLHSRAITLLITGGGTYGQYLWQRDQDAEQRVTVAIATNGGSIAMRATCPAGAALEWDQYGMSDSGMVLYSSRDVKAAYFTRQ
jgi:hypothetical protein